MQDNLELKQLKTKPILPSDKAPLQHHYDNWVFLKVHQDSEGAELRHDSKSAWLSAAGVSLACVVFGTILFCLAKHWAFYAIAGATALALLGMNWYRTSRECVLGTVLRINSLLGTVDLPRQREAFKLRDVELKLQVYSLSDDVGCELNIQVKETGKRFPLTKTLGKDARLLKHCETLAKHGLPFQEEDLTGFKRS